MQFKHAPAAVSVLFDDPNLLSSAGLVPAMRLVERAGLPELVRRWVTVPTDKGANAELKVASLVAGMLAGADSIDDMNVLRHGGMGSLFDSVYAPSTLGSFLRSFTFGHVRQLDAVASRLLRGLHQAAPLLGTGRVFVDIDDTVIEVHGHKKQAAGVGYSGVTGLNALIVTAATAATAPVVIGSRLRRGRVNSPKGAGSLLTESLGTVSRLTGDGADVVVRADSGFYGHKTVTAAIRAGADVSVTMKMHPNVIAAIGKIEQTAWETIKYPRAVLDEQTGSWISDAEVAEAPFTAFVNKPKAEQVHGRLIVRRVKAHKDPGLFDTYRYHAFLTTVPATVMGTVEADRAHRGHAIIEQVHADLKNGPLSHLPSGKFPANSAWLVLAAIALNLTRTVAVIADITGNLTRATTATIRNTLIRIPARIARSARRITIHLPTAWPWEAAFTRLFTTTHDPPATTPN